MPGLTPVLNVVNVRTILLGKPYTDCNPDYGYTAQSCVYTKLMNRIVEICECYPAYVEDARQLINDSKAEKPCNFYLHAACVSFIKVI